VTRDLPAVPLRAPLRAVRITAPSPASRNRTPAAETKRRREHATEAKSRRERAVERTRLMSASSSRIRRTVLALVGALALGGCGSAAPQIVTAPGSQFGSRPAACGTLRIAVNPWVGYDADVAVVSYLARHELGCTVETKAEPEEASWKDLAKGKLDVILENWGHDDLKKVYIDEQKVAVEGGLTGNKGVIGWYVPPWMVQQYPDLTSWKSLKKYAHLFETPTTGGKGQLLDGDPTYVTNDVALVRNLGLDLQVVFAGSEQALITAFQTAEKQRTPLLAYFYSPQWLLSDVKLVHIGLPAYTPGCDADPKKVACDYQPYDLDKIMNKRFADSGSPVVDLIKNFQWTNDDQNQVARDLTIAKLSSEDAAKKWLDTHRAVWQKWLPAG
jgi:glycine betaine/proline transport system substrate-binding protein